jgi:hypothetical protein
MSLTPADYEGIRNLYGRYSRAVDSGDLQGFAECFASDAVYSYGGLPDEANRNGAFVGLEEIKAMGAGIYADTQGHCMHWFNPLTIEGDGDEARVYAYGMVLRRGQAPYSGVILTAAADDKLVRIDGKWVYKERIGYIDPLPEDMALPTNDVLVTARDNFVDSVLSPSKV